MDYDNREKIDNKTDLNTIWEKVKNSKFFSPVEKKKRIDIRKFIPKYNYIKEVKELKLRDYDLKIKNERYKRMKELEILYENKQKELENNFFLRLRQITDFNKNHRNYS